MRCNQPKSEITLQFFSETPETFFSTLHRLKNHSSVVEVRLEFPVIHLRLDKNHHDCNVLIEKCRYDYPHELISADGRSLSEEIGYRCTRTGKRIAFAESCTGGMISTMITDTPGSSLYFQESFVCYSNEAKIKRLGVPSAIIAANGAVSGQTAIAMAEALKNLTGVDIATAITGIAGPEGGTKQKPVGTVFYAFSDQQGSVVHHSRFEGNRTQIRLLAAHRTLMTLRSYLDIT